MVVRVEDEKEPLLKRIANERCLTLPNESMMCFFKGENSVLGNGRLCEEITFMRKR